MNVPSYLMKLCILSAITGTTSTAVRRSVPSLPPVDQPSAILPSAMLMVFFPPCQLVNGTCSIKGGSSLRFVCKRDGDIVVKDATSNLRSVTSH